MTNLRQVPATLGVGGAVVMALIFGPVTWFASRNTALSVVVAVLAAAGWLGAFTVGRYRPRQRV